MNALRSGMLLILKDDNIQMMGNFCTNSGLKNEDLQKCLLCKRRRDFGKKIVEESI